MFEAPSWQQGATAAYLASGVELPPPSARPGSPRGRGVPDISALSGGDGVDCWQIRYAHRDHGEPKDWGCMGGTSTSGPFIGSLVAKLNAARLAKGKGTMGFLNPWLYSAAANASTAIYDVTTGDNCDHDPPNIAGLLAPPAPANLSFGYLAYAGWDPATGLGTPNYNVLEQIALQKM